MQVRFWVYFESRVIGLPDGLEEKCERAGRQGISQVSAGRRGLPFAQLRGFAWGRSGREGRSGTGFGTW